MTSVRAHHTILAFAALASFVLAGADPASAQRKEPPPSREAAQYSFAPIVKKAAPAVVNVYVRARVATFVSPFADDPLFRRFFGERFGMPQERIQNSLGSGVIVTADGIVVTNTHVVKSGRRGRDPDRARRPARVRRQGHPARREVRHRRATDRGRRRPLPLSGVRELRQRRGGRPGSGDRQPVRRRPDRHQRHHLGAGAHGGGELRDAGIHPDGCRHQSRQLGWRADRHGVPRGRHQHRDLLPLRRLARRGLRHPLQHGQADRRQRRGRAQAGAALAGRQARHGDARDGRSAGAGAGRRRHRGSGQRQRSGGGGRAAGRRCHPRRRRPRGDRRACPAIQADDAWARWPRTPGRIPQRQAPRR